MYVDVDTSDLFAVIDEVEDALEVTQADLDEIADFFVARIIGRVDDGVDIYGRPFDAYAKSTARSRARRGRTTSRVTLQDSGRMLAALRGRADGDAALVYFASRTQARKAAWLDEGTRHMPPRRFMDASEEDLEAALELLLDRIEARLDG